MSVRATTRDGGVVLAVADTGMGIPAGEIEGIFSPFFRTSSAYRQQVQGTGLGLAIVRTIVERHGGTIALDSTEGRGTTVTVVLPVAVPAEVVPCPA